MAKVFFTSMDGEVWVNKKHLIEVINRDRKLKPLDKNKGVQRFADLIVGYLNTLYYKEFKGTSPHARPTKNRKNSKHSKT